MLLHHLVTSRQGLHNMLYFRLSLEIIQNLKQAQNATATF